MRPRWVAASDDDACYCHEEPGSRIRCSNCRKHARHMHCEECLACLVEPVGLCEECQAVEDAKFAPRVA